MSEQSRRLIEQIRARLAAARRRVTLADVGFGVIVLIGVVAGILGLSAALEAGFRFDTTGRWILFGGLLLAGLILLILFVVRPILRYSGILKGLEDSALAARIGRRFPEVSDRLVTFLDIAKGRSSGTAAPLVDGALSMLGGQLTPVPFQEVEDLRPAKRAASIAALPLVGVLGALLLVPGFSDAVHRVLSPNTTFEAEALYRLIVEPGEVEIPRGENLQFRISADGEALPRIVTLELIREGEQRSEEIRLYVEEDGSFSHLEENIRQDIRYRAVSNETTSPWHTVRSLSLPAIRGMQVTVHAPRYTGLPPQQLSPNVGDITALPGSTVEIRASVDNVSPDSAAIVFESGRTVPLDVSENTASAGFSIRSEDTYHLSFTSPDGYQNRDPVSYSISTLSDAPPHITLIEPADGTLTESLTTTVTARIIDDYGFNRIALFYRHAERDNQALDSEFETLDLPLEAELLDQVVSQPWLIHTMLSGLRRGDAVAFYVQIWDNNSVVGYQTAQTPIQYLRFPSLREQYEQLHEAEDVTQDGLRRLRENAEESRESFEEMREQLHRNPNPDWEDQRRLEQLMQDHQQMQEDAQQSVEEMREVLEHMERNDLVSEETMELYEELMRIFEEIADPELLRELQELYDAMEEMDMEQMFQSMDEFQFNEDQFRERLERAHELFERMMTARDLEEAARRAEDIAQQEERLAEETGQMQEEGNASQEDLDRLAEQQRQAQEDAAALEEHLESLMERMENMPGAEEMTEQLDQMRQDMQQMQQQMQENQGQLQDGSMQDAQQMQQQMQQQMEDMQTQLSVMSTMMAGQQQQQSIAGLRRVIDDVLALSFGQEDLRDISSRQSADSPAIRESARQQVDLAAGLASVADSLRMLAREIPQMERPIQERAGTAVREMGNATELLAERQPTNAANYQSGALTALNDLAGLLVDLLDQLSSSSSGGGGSMSMQQMMQMLQEMQGDQQQMNESLQQMLNDMQGQRLSIDQQQRLQQMQGQQQQMLEQLWEAIEFGDLDEQTRSDLMRLAEDMENLIEMMESGRMDLGSIREQQENILHRMLEVYDSMNQRGQREEREATPPSDPERQIPPTLEHSDDEADRLRRDLIRALDSGYAPAYQELIKRYFELLQQRIGE